ncbi:acyl carrier protein [Methylocaldum szegediense]|nr:acyl carrier protein [Methylocaldum szegediense]
MSTAQHIIDLLTQVLQLGERGSRLTSDSRLLGELPEFDSMAVVSVLTALEESYGFVVDDDEVEASVFESVASLAEFVEQKLRSRT